MLDCSPTDKLVHHRIAAETICVVGVLISRQARDDRLRRETGGPVPPLPAGARIYEDIRRHVGRTWGVVEFAVKQRTATGPDGKVVERQLQRAVELEPRPAAFRLRVDG